MRFSDIFVDENMKEFRLIDVRLTEQQQSGTITIENGCVKLTERGKQIAAFSSFFRRLFLSKHRLLTDGYRRFGRSRSWQARLVKWAMSVNRGRGAS